MCVFGGLHIKRKDSSTFTEKITNCIDYGYLDCECDILQADNEQR